MDINEKEQQKLERPESHYCKLYKKILRHNGLHPLIESVWCCQYSVPVKHKVDKRLSNHAKRCLESFAVMTKDQEQEVKNTLIYKTAEIADAMEKCKLVVTDECKHLLKQFKAYVWRR